MRLGDVLSPLELANSVASLDVDRVEIDSRLCAPGTLFFGLPGTQADGADYASAAAAQGATCIVTTRHVEGLSIPVIVVDRQDIFRLCTQAACAVVGEVQRDVTLVGVTGTNAKTSVTSIVAELAQIIGWNGASLGTLTNARTTPAAPEMLRSIKDLTSHFATTTRGVIAIEVSSHALDQQRIEGLHFQVAAFTNLTHDHLDYHHDMESYYQAKSLLFRPSMADCAAVWVDDSYGKRLAEELTIPVEPVSKADASAIQLTLESTTFKWRGHLVQTPVIGSYNVDNLLMAFAIMRLMGADDAALAVAASSLHPVAGRFNLIKERGVTAIVDFAHTPDGLRRLLQDILELNPDGRLITVFGCSGERDRAKRSVMGQIALELSDAIIVTTDDPRFEDPNAIIDEIVRDLPAGANWQRLVNRREAISAGLEMANAGDVVVVTGRGHETMQLVEGNKLSFDDRAVIRELMKRV
jgi:UDP-N-acetylmuramoyl-L-alanyl-D-glutamate--2,6-diaminopimelate ligase